MERNLGAELVKFISLFGIIFLVFSAIVKGQTTSAKVDEGFNKYSRQNYAAAIIDFQDVIQTETINPSNNFQLINAYTYLGMCYFEMKEFSKAIPFFKNASEKGGPEYTKPINYLGMCYVELNSYPEAIQIFNELIIRSKEDQLAFLWRGIAKNKSGKVQEGCLDLNRAEQLGNPDAALYIKQFCK